MLINKTTKKRKKIANRGLGVEVIINIDKKLKLIIKH